MKLPFLLFFSITLLFVSCGNDETIENEIASTNEAMSKELPTTIFDSKKFEGGWVPDMSTLDIHLSEYFPQDVYAFMEGFEFEAKNDQAELDAEFVFEMIPNGVLKLGEIGEVLEYQWFINGAYLHVKGLLEEEPLVGKPFDFSFQIVELNDTNFVVKLESKHLLDEVEQQFSEELKEEMTALPLVKMFLNDSILNQTWATLAFKKR